MYIYTNTHTHTHTHTQLPHAQPHLQLLLPLELALWKGKRECGGGIGGRWNLAGVGRRGIAGSGWKWRSDE